MNHRVRWHLGALASVVALLASLASLDAQALALGQVTVQSALGEPLRAEIDIAEITTDEAASLRVGVANADAFKAAGLEYTPAVIGMQVTLQKRPDGRSYLRLSSSRPVAEPFVDLVLEASWSSGRIMRDYTMLFDPPSLRSGSAGGAAPITAPVLPHQAPADIPPARDISDVPHYPTSPPPADAAAVAPTPAPVSAPAGEKQVAVKSGDTAGKIAVQNKPASVSLDQMLVALLRSNPDAFIGGNVNRLKAGAVLDIPADEQAESIPAGEATRTIIAQAKDFNEFRRKLAEGVPTGSASRQAAGKVAAGKVQAKVEDRAAPTAASDKLTLSKGAVQGKAAAEEKIAKDRQAKDASTRVAELTKNIADLNKLTGSPPASGVTSVVTVAPGVTPTSTTVATLSPTVAPITASVTSETTAVATLKPAAAAAASSGVAKKPAAAPPPPPPEPSLIDELMDNPYVLPGAGGLLLLLGAFGFYRYKKKKHKDAAQVDSSFLESRLQPDDSFFGASGGQRIDTTESGATDSSLVYSPSHLDAAGDVDPVAEADVYLAYGRDLQAEEILKEAMRTSPTRVAIHAKLMEIYAKRRDIKAFEVVAAQAFNLTHGQGPEWAYISVLGRDLDPGNPMYQPGGQAHTSTKATEKSAQDQAAAAFGSSTIPQMLTAHPKVAAAPMDFDLDLNFSIGDEPAVTAAPVPAPPVATAPEPAYESEPTITMQLPSDPIFDALAMDFSLDDTQAIKATPEAPAAQATAPPPAPPAASVVAALDSGMLEFDLSSLSLDLGGPTTKSPSLAASGTSALSVSGDPLETKFALAEEFRTLGDTDGARSLAEEVATQAKGPLKSKAQSFLASLS